MFTLFIVLATLSLCLVAPAPSRRRLANAGGNPERRCDSLPVAHGVTDAIFICGQPACFLPALAAAFLFVQLQSARCAIVVLPEGVPTERAMAPSPAASPEVRQVDASKDGDNGRFEDLPANGVGSRKVALVLGNSEYQFAPHLANPPHEARQIAQALQSAAEYHVLLATELTRVQIMDTFRRFVAEASKADAAIFYYSGHAVQVDGENYIMPVDAHIEEKIDIEINALSISSLLRILQSAVPIKVFILDACRDDPFQALQTRALGSAGLAPMKVTEVGTYLMYSTAPGGIAEDGVGALSPFAEAFVRELRANPDREIDDLFRSVRRQVVMQTAGRQIPWSASMMIDSFFIRHEPNGTPALSGITIDSGLLPDLRSSTLEVAGRHFDSVDELRAASAADPGSIFKRGLNTISSAGRNLQVWYEERNLKRFEEPYHHSYAIVAAIDKYSASPTAGHNHPNLNFMVQNASNLIAQIKTMGFPDEHIIFLPDQLATSTAIESALRKFWKGGQYDDADRLMFYFGGHGETLPSTDVVDTSGKKRGALVTYDFDPDSPALSSVLLDDLLSRHSRYITAKHVLFLIDSCSSGLLLPQYQGNDDSVHEAFRWQKLAMLKADTSEPARDFLLAGTGEEKALWINGGIFTQALVEALKGKADWASDRLIEFEELALQVRRTVTAKAAETGVVQAPTSLAIGNGRFVFVSP